MSSIQQMLAESDRGKLLDDAEYELATILAAIGSDFDRKGEISIKFKVTTKNGVIIINSSVTAKLSEPERLPTMMFLDDNGNLGRKDPRQPVMPSVVDADTLNNRRTQQ
jgi:hypothetical protein